MLSGVSGYLKRSPHFARKASRGRDVTAQGIVHHHAVGIEAPPQGANGALHPLDPSAWQAVAISLIIQGDYFVGQDAIEIFAIAGIVHIHARMGAPGTD